MERYIGTWEIVGTSKFGESTGRTIAEVKKALLDSIRIYGVSGHRGAWSIYQNDENMMCLVHGYTRTKK